MRSNRRTVFLGLVVLLSAMACDDPSCGGCVTPPAEPFPEQPRVYDGVQVRLTDSGVAFIEQSLPTMIRILLQDGLTFEIPTSEQDLGITVTICQMPCQVQVEIQNAAFNLIEPDRIAIDATVDVDGAIAIDSILGSCEIPILMRDKPVSAQVILQVDPATRFFNFDVFSIEVAIDDDDYQIVCPDWPDLLLEEIKSVITVILNVQVHEKINTAIKDLVIEQTCATCDFYTAGCPAGSDCSGNGFCTGPGGCVIKPLGLVGELDLGAQLESIDPSSDATLDILVALGQAQQPDLQPLVSDNGILARLIGGSYSDRHACVLEPDPAQVPDTGSAPTMQFGDVVPSTGASYMVGAAVADMYLDHFVYQLWRSGFLCLTIDSYSLDLLSSASLALILPSLDTLTNGANLPVRLALHPLGVPNVEVGAGTFLPDGSVDEPILYFFMPELRMDFLVRLYGRWVRFLSVLQDVRIDVALEFTQHNSVKPILDGDSIAISDVVVSGHELLAEPEQQLADLVPQLIELALPQLLGSLQEFDLPRVGDAVLEVKSVRGEVQRAGTDYYEFLSLYADLVLGQPRPLRPCSRPRLVRPGRSSATGSKPHSIFSEERKLP